MGIMFYFPTLLVLQNKACHMFFYFKEMAISLNGSHNISYAVIFIFFSVIILFNAIPDSLLKYLHFFS